MTRVTGAAARRSVVVVAALALLLTSSAVQAPPSSAEIGYGELAFMYPSGDPASDEYHLGRSNATGSERRLLTSQRGIGRPSWSPDGTRIAFSGPVGDGSLGRYGIYVINADGSGLRRLTAPRYGDFDPAWSPDGRFIAFRRDVRGTTRQSNCCELWVMNANGTGGRVIPGTANGSYPTWKPDSRTIAFSHPSGLRVVNTDGSGLKTLFGGSVTQPDWSPDGRLIAFVRVYSPDRSNLWTIPAQGGSPTIRTDPGFQVESPSWAEDSRTIFFVGYRGRGYEGRTTSSVWRVGGYGQLSLMFGMAKNLHHLSYVPRIDYVGDMPVSGDWSAAGGDNLGIVRPSGGTLRWYLRGTSIITPYGSVGDTPVAGDWNNDGRSEPGVVRRVGDRLQWHLRGSLEGGTYRTFYYGSAGDIPVVGDWNGDGYDTVGVARPYGQRLQWHLTNVHEGRTAATFLYGSSTDQPVTGDWDDDGVDEVGVARVVGDTWQWHVRSGVTSGGTLRTFTYGIPSRGDWPVTGNWSGSGADGPAITRPRNGVIEWYLLNSYRSNGTDRRLSYGYH